MGKRKIKAHKGGRASGICVKIWLTPEEKKQWDAIVKRQGLSKPDWVVKNVKEQANG